MDVSKTALVLIDLQKESDFGIEGASQAINHSKYLIQTCRDIGIPIIYTRQLNRSNQIGLSNGEPIKDDGTPVYYSTDTTNVEIFDEIAPEGHDIVIDKYRWSGFFQTPLDSTLKSMGIKHVIMGGFVTDGCLMTSVFDAYFRDYQVNLVKDICATSNEGAHMASIMIMANWIYDMTIYQSSELIKKLRGEDYRVWESPGPDSLQFTPENMRDVFHTTD
ncbi:cysteine hydrolase family protein [Tuberibacillus sp. Marseille-P3662]|uniref:cysteine hydrolase family protein n=1 Tax=Tuberibacillus sp. Marseille-P3662 TaxID=1965358 RepID=UPI000A1C80F2|nr:isochorismatase family cysteine hydrolase [Tuberibacillus sp. Marseille-P3662]